MRMKRSTSVSPSGLSEDLQQPLGGGVQSTAVMAQVGHLPWAHSGWWEIPSYLDNSTPFSFTALQKASESRVIIGALLSTLLRENHLQQLPVINCMWPSQPAAEKQGLRTVVSV